MILILFMTFMYKTMGGGGSWILAPREPAPVVEEAPVPFLEVEPRSNPRMEEIEEAVDVVTGQFSLAWQSLKHVFTPAVFRGLVGFSTWWCCLSWFLSAAIGITYQSYFAKA